MNAFLYIARNTKVVEGGVSLMVIKQAAMSIPDKAVVSNDLCHLLDELSAVIFHVAFAARKRTAEDWYKTHEFIPTGRSAETNSTYVVPALQGVMAALLSGKEQKPLIRRRV